LSSNRAPGQKVHGVGARFFPGAAVLAAWVGSAIILAALPLPSQVPHSSPAASTHDLGSILKKLAEYCSRLENAAFDFVCLEEIKEKIDPALDLKRPRETLKDWAFWDLARWNSSDRPMPNKINNSYLYDYQCVRANRQIRETRTLLQEGRRKTREPNAQLRTAVVVYGNALLWPVGLFGERFQSHYDYKIAGEEMGEGRHLIVIDATPKLGVPEARSLYGKAWVDRQTLDILKIEWSEKHIGRYEIFTKRGELYKRTPRLRVRSEFAAEKNGIRFPSSMFIEEAYLNDRGRVFVRSLTTVVYRNFKFFTVEVETPGRVDE
jgi:hypothetical protein